MINESRLINGTLTLGPDVTGMVMSCQITNVRITSAYSDDGSTVTTLCGDTKPAPRTLDGRKLEGTFVQDFDLDEAAGGVVDYVWNHDLEVVAYTFTPNDVATCPVITGNLMIEVPAETYGGDVNKRITSDFAWNMQDEPVRTYSAGTATSSRQKATAGASAEVSTDTGPQIEVVGWEAFSASMASAERRLDYLPEAPKEAAQIIAEAGAREAPVLTGRLAASLRARKLKNSAKVSSALVYGIPIHWGRPAHNIAPNEFLMRAAEQTADQWQAAYNRDLQHTCDQVKGA